MDAVSSLAVEHLAFVVHHAALGILAHAATAERMRGRGLVPDARCSKWTLDVARADGLRCLGESVIDAGIDRLVAGARPSDLGLPLVERDAAAGIVMRDDEEGV